MAKQKLITLKQDEWQGDIRFVAAGDAAQLQLGLEPGADAPPGPSGAER